jgi:hypothetical protein
MSMLTAARSLRSLRATSFVAAVVCVACGSAGAGTPRATPTTFVRQVTNPWFPLKPGTTFIYEGRKDHEPGRDVVRVTARTKVINGVRCTEVDDRLYLNGRLAERTKDWYAQDGAGNVWYFGETTAELDRTGRVTSREAPGRPASTVRSPASSSRRIRRSASHIVRSTTRATPKTISGSSACRRLSWFRTRRPRGRC